MVDRMEENAFRMGPLWKKPYGARQCICLFLLKFGLLLRTAPINGVKHLQAQIFPNLSLLLVHP